MSDVPLDVYSGSEQYRPTERQLEELRLLEQLRNSPDLFRAIATASPAELQGQRRLRLEYNEALVRMALSVQAARNLAAGRLPAAEQLWLTRVGLEQSTAWAVALHKARQFRQRIPGTAPPQIADLCSGIGVDAFALATIGNVTAVDSDPVMLLRLQWNVEAWNSQQLKPAFSLQTVCADVTAMDWTDRIVHVDPDRRGGRDRPVKRLELYQPDLTWMQQLTSTAAGGAIKISPASNFMQKFAGCEIELISLDGECREATVWFGSLAGPHPFRATVLSAGATLAGEPLSAMAPQAAECGAWVFDPDPAVVRSGLLDVVATELGLARLDPAEEYLTGTVPVASAFVRGFRVEAVLPNNLKEVRRWLRQHPSCHYEIKCRHVPIDASAVRRILPVGVAAARVLLFARIQGRTKVIMATREQCAPVS